MSVLGTNDLSDKRPKNTLIHSAYRVYLYILEREIPKPKEKSGRKVQTPSNSETRWVLSDSIVSHAVSCFWIEGACC